MVGLKSRTIMGFNPSDGGCIL